MNIVKNKKIILSIVMWIFVFSQTLFAEVLYVDQRATGLNTGSAWDQAFTDFHKALEMAQTGDEIRMATGVYTPAGPDGDPNATFLLVSGVAVMGGYAGVGADDPDLRDVNEFPTILSGDLDGNDGDNWSHREDNVFHVVTATGTDANTVLDGLTIADGHAFEADRAYIPWLDPNSRGFSGTDKSSGGGLIVRNSKPDQVSTVALQNCVFRNNTSIFGGAAICSVGHSALILHKCEFVYNYGEFSAGAIENRLHNSETFLSHCNFKNNGSKTRTSVIETNFSIGLTAEYCRFLGNLCTKPYPSGSLLDCGIGDVSLVNCLFSGNRHETIISTSFGKLSLLNCTIVGNEVVAHPGGSAVESRGSDLRIVNSIIWGNPLEPDPNIDQEFYDRYPYYQLHREFDIGSFLVDHSLIETWIDNDTPGSMYPDSDQKDPLFVNADGPDDVFGTTDDDFRLLPGSPCIDAGINETDPNLAETDLAGRPRIINRVVDIGAYEFEGIIYVDQWKPDPRFSGPYLGTALHPFEHVQSAVDVALTGHTVIVAPGVYSLNNYELKLTGHNIILRSQDPSDPVTANRTILSGTIVFEGSEGPDCMVAGFRIQHNQYGAIYGNQTRATLKYCYLIDNAPCDGSVLVECDGLIQNCLIADNWVNGNCGSYPVVYRCSATFVNCTIANNDSGIHVNNASFENCILYHNVDPHIYVESRGEIPGSLLLDTCDVEDPGYSNGEQTGDHAIVAAKGTVSVRHTIQGDPLFTKLGTNSGGHGSMSAEASLGDYHLKTPGWRWSPVTIHGSHWVYDAIEMLSPCIDRGDPALGLGEELMTVPDDPEGLFGINRSLNLGVYGGTWQASLAPPIPPGGGR